jgi:hypothetical protein
MFRFTIRDLLWLTLLVGVGIGVWLSASRREQRIQERLDSLIDDRLCTKPACGSCA